ncbi:trehalase [Anaeramoeba ignava]|uniref:Trehalase n=1 Tax=Anaeramoeba ignava TaxID=1746090 RepID=A0A9Q0L9D5_ANAIG|nr:trehalase [Anaeramoeba ignava]|eukprot:Anaeramoba_ignava/a348793_54.p1 GENE.a348793_54~~a348793_54.p1  ORF type:complete len:709 (+),score=180.14 a348793_54:168-2294(+)
MISYTKLFLFLFLFTFSYLSSPNALPSFMLNNWKNQMMTWASAKNCLKEPAVRYPGINNFYSSYDSYGKSVMSSETFALKTNKIFGTNPELFSGPTNGGVFLDTSGALSTLYTTYDGNTLDVSVQKTYWMPPEEDVILVEYILKNTGSETEYVTLLNFATSGVVSSENRKIEYYNCAHTWFDNSSKAFYFDESYCDAKVMVSGTLDNEIIYKNQFSVGNGDKNDGSNPLNVFKNNNGILNSQSDWWANMVSFGSIFTVTLAPGQSVTRYLYYSIQPDVQSAVSFAQQMQSVSASSLIQSTKQSLANWLSQGVQPNNLNSDEMEMFQISLLGLKMAQNPTVGTIAASFHPLYGYKVWSRDGVFAAMILDAAGYSSEAELFLNWAASAELRSDGFFHTCYDVFTGQPVSFVEPQIDGTASFLLSILYHISRVGNTNFLKNNSPIYQRMEAIENFFLNDKGSYNLAIPDYSIWEESSDPHTGNPLPTQYYTFSQSMSYAGLKSASIIENALGNQDRSTKLYARSQEIKSAMETHLWDSQNGYFYRGLWSDTLSPDTRVDSSTMAAIFTGLSTEQSVINMVVNSLTHQTYGIARYTKDPFFYNSIYNPCGQEVGDYEPPWGVVTMFTAMSEFELNSNELISIPQIVLERLQWMVDHSAYGNNPVGECIDGTGTGEFVFASAPDLYEHGGVYVFTTLLSQGLVPPWNPDKIPI